MDCLFQGQAVTVKMLQMALFASRVSAEVRSVLCLLMGISKGNSQIRSEVENILLRAKHWGIVGCRVLYK